MTPLSLSAQAFAARITERWKASIESIIEAGRLLIEAKEQLSHGEFGAMCEGMLPFTQRTAQMLMVIAKDGRISNPKFISHLPASWGSLYDLTRLSDEEFAAGIEQHIIRPDMIRADADKIRPLVRAPHHDATGEPPEPILKHHHIGQRDRHNDGSPVALDDGKAFDASPEAPTMPSGGLAIAHRRLEDADSVDYFPTPPWATRALFERVLVHLGRRATCKFQFAWEPACGEGHMAEVLREYFRKVHASDLIEYGYGDAGEDFLRADLQGFDWIISNPPFNISVDFVRKALDLAGTGVAMFVRMAWLEGNGRYDRIFRDRPPTLVSFFVERVPLHKGRWEPDGDTFTAYVWLVWLKGAEPRAPFWIPPGCREALARPDDEKRFTQKPVQKAQGA